ncbi:MAG: succinate dehydrogenase, cytochrome b556 subunit [Chloroflexota bacterium]
MSQSNLPSANKAWKWFNPLGRQVGGWAFILNRVTALGLTLYLFLHLLVLGQLAQGEAAYQGFLDLIHSPVFILGEMLVVAAGIFHALNGLRIVLTSFGIGVTSQKQLFVGLLLVTVVAVLVFTVRAFAG